MLIPNGECNYLLSGKLPTVRQAIYSQACTQQPHTCTQQSHRHAPKSRIHAPKSIHRLAPNNHILCTESAKASRPNLRRQAGRICKGKPAESAKADRPNLAGRPAESAKEDRPNLAGRPADSGRQTGRHYGTLIFEIFWLFAKWSRIYLKVFLWCLGA